ncbi:uncharacterized protein FOBCDRAFT_198048 [Fusarium oxysporum Fo47]|uniref:Uncharacterized protein n=3 Tax=Fusarium oxysporum TaxID=5507 RepID=W9KGN6_FUSOX|nr:uncharacterized protein FOBCDRAFT_198048 [Fusarium oxysporum Fo47]EWZ43567.1 hypothetical protein FOZG_04659 [Fusarium oxysporum Fo47]EWZ99561.1 hypothetical protein FOWG_03222 [Fusarium oxysporum f. sp. lycopersici MN25]WJG34899.1 hypothetical protein FOBCDRAFT_198048 [Fusarium oxysporum Fo47]
MLQELGQSGTQIPLHHPHLITVHTGSTLVVITRCARDVGEDGIEDWASTYERRLETWPSAMEKGGKDDRFILRLSAYMRESWATGRFWMSYAARTSWSFVVIYWKYLDERFFNKRAEGTPTKELWKARVQLLTDDKQEAMEVLVKTKVEESKEGILINWEAEKARQHLSSFLVT